MSGLARMDAAHIAAVLSKFLPVVREIAAIAAADVHRQLSSLSADEIKGLTRQEQRELRQANMTDADLDALARRLTRAFEEGRAGMPLLYNAAVREVGIVAVRRAVTPYSVSEGDAVVYYETKYKPVLDKLRLPVRALRIIDSNLSAYLPPLGKGRRSKRAAADRGAPPRWNAPDLGR